MRTEPIQAAESWQDTGDCKDKNELETGQLQPNWKLGIHRKMPQVPAPVQYSRVNTIPLPQQRVYSAEKLRVQAQINRNSRKESSEGELNESLSPNGCTPSLLCYTSISKDLSNQIYTIPLRSPTPPQRGSWWILLWWNWPLKRPHATNIVGIYSKYMALISLLWWNLLIDKWHLCTESVQKMAF